MKILQISNNNYDSKEEESQRFSPLHFGYHELKEMGYQVDLLYPKEPTGIWKLLYKLFGGHIIDIYLQYRCIKKSNDYDIIFYPIDRHCIALAIFRKLRLIRCPIIMLCHFSLNTKYVKSRKKKIYKAIERKLVFKYLDMIVFPCERLKEVAMEMAPKGSTFGVAHWGADCEWYSKYRKVPSECDYYMGCGGTNRDYETLIKAVKHTSIRIKIYTSTAQICKLKQLEPTDNVEMIEAIGPNRKEILRQGYSNAKAVLIPIKNVNDVPNGATVLVEALASGKPVIISDLETNFLDVEKEEIGIKVKLHDVEGWKKVLLMLDNSPLLLDKFGENALYLAKNKYNLAQLAKELSDYFIDIYNKRGES